MTGLKKVTSQGRSEEREKSHAIVVIDDKDIKNPNSDSPVTLIQMAFKEKNDTNINVQSKSSMLVLNFPHLLL